MSKRGEARIAGWHPRLPHPKNTDDETVKPPTPVMCANCGDRPGTVRWIGEGGILAVTHGFISMWCEVCVAQAQLRYAREQAARVPELEAELKRLLIEDIAREAVSQIEDRFDE